ncbi:MAG: VWA domain-containing protein [Pirellulales bacterium]
MLLALFVGEPELHGAREEPSRSVGIVLVRNDRERPEYFDEHTDAADQRLAPDAVNSPTGDATGGEAGAGSTSSGAPLDVDALLPKAPQAGPGALSGSGIPTAASGDKGVGKKPSVGGQGSTRIFGIEGKGYKFVYVFDRSGSMSEPAGRPLAAAKAELIGSLGSLERTHQFQVIFFNHEQPRAFVATGRAGRLAFADDATKEEAVRFIRGITPSGGTDPEPALSLALRLAPDVVFFLTDGQDLNFAIVERVTRKNRAGAVINTVEFGAVKSQSDGLLRQLAERNRGRYAYVNTSALP